MGCAILEEKKIKSMDIMDRNLRKDREIAVQLVFSLNEGEIDINDSLVFFMSVFQVSKKRMLEYFENAKKIFDKRKSVDSYLESISEEYSIDRIAKVDLAILRVILCELIEETIPVEIAIAEAIRIANKFSSFGSGKYLHAMIDSIYKETMHEKSTATV